MGSGVSHHSQVTTRTVYLEVEGREQKVWVILFFLSVSCTSLVFLKNLFNSIHCDEFMVKCNEEFDEVAHAVTNGMKYMQIMQRYKPLLFIGCLL